MLNTQTNCKMSINKADLSTLQDQQNRTLTWSLFSHEAKGESIYIREKEKTVTHLDCDLHNMHATKMIDDSSTTHTFQPTMSVTAEGLQKIWESEMQVRKGKTNYGNVKVKRQASS